MPAIKRQMTVGEPGELIEIGLVRQFLFGLDPLVDFALQAFVLLVQDRVLL